MSDVLKRVFVSATLFFAFIFYVCAKPAVVVHTEDGLNMESADRATLLGSNKPSRDKDALCNGDLNKILADSSLDPEQKEKTRSLICGGKDSVSAFRDFYYGLPDNQRIDLRRVFALYGYHI